MPRNKNWRSKKKLKLEYAMLKSPQRIENIARNKLEMSYPDNGQVIVLNKPENEMATESKERLKFRIIMISYFSSFCLSL